MKLKQIKTAFNSLELIIHKKKFLIPNKPHRPLTSYIKFISSEKQLIKSVVDEKKFELTRNKMVEKNKSLYNNTVKELIDLPHPAYQKIKEECQKQAKNFIVMSDEYNQKFIKPSNFTKSTLYSYFMSKFHQEIKSENPSINSKQLFKVIGQKWKELYGPEVSEKQQAVNMKKREQLEREFEEIRKKQLKVYEQYIEKHEIPPFPNFSGYNVFISEKVREGMKLGVQTNSEYKKLSDQERHEYEQRAAEKAKKMMDKYQEFLKKWNITHQQLLNIRYICNEYEKATNKTLKKNTKKIIEESMQQPEESK